MQNDKSSFADLIGTVAHGSIDEDATNELKALVAEMQRLERTMGGKPKGKIVLSLSLTLDRGIFDAQASTKVTFPAKVQPRALLYGSKDGLLSEEDTRQHSFDLDPKDVSTAAAGTVRDIKDHRKLAGNDRE